MLGNRGPWVVHDESAGAIVHLLDIKPGDDVIDCCAAPGGKALMILHLLSGNENTEGHLTAIDVSDSKLGLLRKSAKERQLEDKLQIIRGDVRNIIKDTNLKKVVDIS